MCENSAARAPSSQTTISAHTAFLGRRTLTMTTDIQIALPARAENIAIVRHALGALEDAYALDAQTLSDIRLAVTEACTNVVVHAYPDGGEGPMEVLATLLGDELHVIVRDEGTGIVPRPDSPGLGLGLPLIASLAESVQLGRDEQQRTEVQMTFSLNNAPHHYDGTASNGVAEAQDATGAEQADFGAASAGAEAAEHANTGVAPVGATGAEHANMGVARVGAAAAQADPAGQATLGTAESSAGAQ